MGSQPPGQTFMFVNEQSLATVSGRRSRAQKSAILSYAQTRRREREKRAQGPSAEKATEAGIQARTLTSPSSAALAGSRKQTLQTAPLLSHTFPIDNGSDPFYCTVAGRDGRALSCLKDALAVVERNTFLAESFAPQSAIQRGDSRLLQSTLTKLQRCVSDPMVMYSTLAFGSTYLGWILGEFYDTEVPEYYLGKVLGPLQARMMDLQSAPDLWLLFSISALAVTEMWSGLPEIWLTNPRKLRTIDTNRLENSRIHLRALCSLVERLGGWTKVEFFLLKDCILTDKFLALYTIDTPLLPLSWDPGTYPEANEDSSRAEPLSLLYFGWRHERVPEAQSLKQLLADIVEYVRQAEFAWQAVPATSTAKWLFLRHQALIYRLLLLQDTSPIDECIRLATLIYLLMLTEYKGARLSASVTSRYLRKAIVLVTTTEDDVDDDTLFWCACTGAMASESWDEEPWFIELTTDISQKIGTAPVYEALRRELSAFLFLESKQEKKLRTLVKQVSQQR